MPPKEFITSIEEVKRLVASGLSPDEAITLEAQTRTLPLINREELFALSY